jgi:hypothetical protein
MTEPTTMPEPVTQDSHGRPVRAVIGRLGAIIGYRRADLPAGSTPAMSATPDGAYPADWIDRRRPMARPLTDQERAELEPYRCGCGADVPMSGHRDGCPANDPVPVAYTAATLEDWTPTERVRQDMTPADAAAFECPATADDGYSGWRLECVRVTGHAGPHIAPTGTRW